MAEPRMPEPAERPNVDRDVVRGFGEEWTRFDQRSLSPGELEQLFGAYFHIFPWDRLPAQACGFDLGCGSGRWARMVAPRVAQLHCIDPSDAALAVTRASLQARDNVQFHLADAEHIPLDDSSMDFGYSLGVLHHIPDTARALAQATRKLKPGAPFLLYLYYRFDNRPAWYRLLWQGSDLIRRGVSALPSWGRNLVADAIAATIYWPLARLARLVERRGGDASGMPLEAYRDCSFYTMRTDALDRFGTRLEQRFTRAEMLVMMTDAGLQEVRFSERTPFWVATGIRRA
jgi:SAM-dependent methyltransferase